jgi:low temperature requirement protein LtrA
VFRRRRQFDATNFGLGILAPDRFKPTRPKAGTGLNSLASAQVDVEGARVMTLLRSRMPHDKARVTNIELFFDLVFAFAITQLSHLLLSDLSRVGILRTALLFLAVWWVWIYTCWVTNWLDPERAPVRLLLLVLSLAGLVMSTALPSAFDAGGLAFAVPYVAMQTGRSLFMLWALGRENPRNSRNFQRITCWLAVAGVFWIAGALFADGELRLDVWLLALSLEYTGPALGFFVPGLGRSTTADWDVEGAHMAERSSLFIIIALGESLLVTGASFGEAAWTLPTVAGFLAGFIASAAMWWIYFDSGAERGIRRIAESSDPGRLARLVYTYYHLLIVAGIIVAAVGDEIILAHPRAASGVGTIAVVLGGLALFLAGNTLFKRAVGGRYPLSHLVGVLLLAVLAPLGYLLPVLALGAAATAVLVIVAVWEKVSLGRGLKATGPRSRSA